MKKIIMSIVTILCFIVYVPYGFSESNNSYRFVIKSYYNADGILDNYDVA